MRLSEAQVQYINNCLKDFFPHLSYQLFLYGSRVHDELRGGDIDLALQVSESEIQKIKQNHLEILVKLKKGPLIGERRIDFKIFTLKDLENDEFLQKISRGWILIGNQ